MSPVTRQDVQNIVQVALNRAMERVATKQDIILLTDTIRNLTALHQQSQQLLKQSEYQRLQLARRAVSLEGRITSLENEIRSLHATVAKAMQQKQPQIVIPAQSTEQFEQPATSQYVFRPN